jgi:hypothetical protein
MPTLKIGDKRVTVGDEFLSLSPAEQQATVEQIASQIGIDTQQQEAPQKPQEPSWGETGMDVAKSFGTGLGKGAMGLAGAIGDVQQMTGDLASWGAGKLGFSPETQQMASSVAQRIAVPGFVHQAPRTEQIQGTVESFTGPMYQPKTTLGQFGQTMGEFAPGAAMGPGGLMRKAALTAIPAIASEGGGQIAREYLPAAEPYARIGGALAGGLAASSGGKAPIKEMLKNAKSEDEVMALKNQAYADVKAAGIIFEPNAYKSTAMKIQNELRQHGLLPQQNGPDAALLNMVMERAKSGKINGWTEVDSIRQDAGLVAYGGKATEQEAARAKIIRKHLDDLVDKGKVMSLRGVPRDQVKPMVDTARELARRTIIARDIGKMENKANWYVSGEESGLRNQFASYGKKKGQYLTPAEEAAFKKVVNREGPLNLAHSLGSRGSLITQMAASAMGAPYSGGLSLLAGIGGAGASLAARKGMEAYTKSGVKNAVKTVLAGKEAQRKAMSQSRKLKDAGRAQTLLATDSGVRSQEPFIIDARGNAYPMPLLGR